MAETIKIGGELESMATGNIVTRAHRIYDEAKEKHQGQVNAETDQTLATHTSAINGLEGQNYVTLIATDADADIAAVFTRLGVTPATDTIYRIGNWKHDATTKYNVNYYSEYAATGTTTADLVPISVENKGIDTKPIPDSHNPIESGAVHNSITKRNRIFDFTKYAPQSIPEIYEECISELYIFPEYVNKSNNYIGVWSYGSGGVNLAVECVNSLTEDSVWHSFRVLPNTLSNGDIWGIKTSSNSPSIPDTTVGYVVFKDIATFRANVLGNASTRVDISSVVNIGNSYLISDHLLRTKIVNDLTTGGIDKALSAQQGVVIKGLVDNLALEDKRMEDLSALTALPMVKASSVLGKVYRGNDPSNVYILPLMMSNFLIDMKLHGVAEEGYMYLLDTINFNNGGNYNQYLAIYKYDSLGNGNLLGAVSFAESNPQTGTKSYTINVSGQSVTQIDIAVNWEALTGIAGGQYYTLYSAGYRFDVDYLFDLTRGYLAEIKTYEDLSATKQDVDELQEKMARTEGLIITEDSVAWQLANDTFSTYYDYKNLGQYTKVMKYPAYFNQIRVNQIRTIANTQSEPINYKAYIVMGLADSAKRDVPVGAISSLTHTLIKEGVLYIGTSYKDYIIQLERNYLCPEGSQVVVYLEDANGINMNMSGIKNGIGNADETSNCSLLNTNADPWTTAWGTGTFNPSQNKGYFNVALTLLITPTFYLEEDGKELEERVDELESTIGDDLVITIPDTIYAIAGTEVNLWNDAISLSVDRGLNSPANYQVRWECSKGLITDRCFRYTPTDVDAGTTVGCTCFVYNMYNHLVATKSFFIKVLAKDALVSAKNIVYFGDSLGQNAAIQLYNNFANTDKFAGVIPTMLGTKGTTPKYEAVGGYRWADYATAGRRAFRCQVSGVDTIAINSRYTNNGFTWTVIEVNVTDGSGNILITKEDTGGSNAPELNGILTPVSTGDSIPYTNATLEGANPLWDSTLNGGAGGLSVSKYKQTLGLQPTDKIDAVSFQFGINDNTLADDLSVLNGYIEALYDAFIADNPDCKFIIGLTTSAGNDVNGSGVNYGATNDWITYLNNVYRIRQFYLSLQENQTRPNIVIAPISLEVDRYYGYGFSTRAVSQRTSVEVQYHNNYVHPGSDGYGQIADAYFAAYISALIEI